MSREELNPDFEPNATSKPVEFSDLNGAQIKGPDPLADVEIRYEERVTYDGVELVPIKVIKPAFPTPVIQTRTEYLSERTKTVSAADAFVRSLPRKGGEE